MSALGELLESLRLVEHTLERARGQLTASRTALSQAEAALAQLVPEHPDTVVPPGMRRADEHIERTDALINGALEQVRTFAEKL